MAIVYPKIDRNGKQLSNGEELLRIKRNNIITQDLEVKEDEVVFCYGLIVNDNVTLDIKGLLIDLENDKGVFNDNIK